MTHSYGQRSGTRYKFAKGFRQNGMPALSRYLTVFKRGDYVTLKADGAVQKGMPHSFYHGRVGVVYDVTKRAIGVQVPKRVGSRQEMKRLHVRVEHVVKSRCREEFLNRRAENDRIRREAKKEGKSLPEGFTVKRTIAGPTGAKKVAGKDAKWLAPLAFTESF